MDLIYSYLTTTGTVSAQASSSGGIILKLFKVWERAYWHELFDIIRLAKSGCFDCLFIFFSHRIKPIFASLFRDRSALVGIKLPPDACVFRGKSRFSQHSVGLRGRYLVRRALMYTRSFCTMHFEVEFLFQGANRNHRKFYTVSFPNDYNIHLQKFCIC